MAAEIFIVLAIAAVVLLLWWLMTKPLHEVDRTLSDLFKAYIRSGFAVVHNGEYELHLTGPIGELRFWNANRWYAWASEGSFTPTTNSAEPSIIWKKRMPGRFALHRMRRAFEAAEARRLAAFERGEVSVDLHDMQGGGYCVKRPVSPTTSD